MKTVRDLNSLIPYIIQEINKQSIADSTWEDDYDEDGRWLSEIPGYNFVTYIQDGWFIEVSFYSYDDGHNEVRDTNVYFENPISGEIIDFEGEELRELINAIENINKQAA